MFFYRLRLFLRWQVLTALVGFTISCQVVTPQETQHQDEEEAIQGAWIYTDQQNHRFDLFFNADQSGQLQVYDFDNARLFEGNFDYNWGRSGASEDHFDVHWTSSKIYRPRVFSANEGTTFLGRLQRIDDNKLDIVWGNALEVRPELITENGQTYQRPDENPDLTKNPFIKSIYPPHAYLGQGYVYKVVGVDPLGKQVYYQFQLLSTDLTIEQLKMGLVGDEFHFQLPTDLSAKKIEVKIGACNVRHTCTWQLLTIEVLPANQQPKELPWSHQGEETDNDNKSQSDSVEEGEPDTASASENDSAVADSDSSGILDVLLSFPFPGRLVHGITYGEGFIWAVGYEDHKVYKLSLDGSVVSNFVGPGSSSTGITYVNEKLWIADDRTKQIYQVDLEGNVITQVSAPGGDSTGMAFDGTYLWNGDFSEGGGIHKFDFSGNIISSYPSPGGGPEGLTYAQADNTIWHADISTGKVYQLTIDGSLINTYESPTPKPIGLAHDGGHLWLSDQETNMIYKLQVNNQE